MIRMGDRISVLVDGERQTCVVLTIRTVESLVTIKMREVRKARRVIIECAVLSDIADGFQSPSLEDET